MQEFKTAVGRVAFNEGKDIRFTIDDREMTAHPPTTGQLALFMRTDGVRAVPQLLSFLSDVLEPNDWRWCEARIHQGVGVEVFAEVTTWLIGEWAGRPTLPATGSSDTPSDTGGSSTEKQPAKVAASS